MGYGLHDDGFFDGDADIEQAELEEAGRRAAVGYRRMKQHKAAGNLEAAMHACPHGWSGPVSAANRNLLQCYHCGSRMEEQPNGRRVATVPCEFPVTV